MWQLKKIKNREKWQTKKRVSDNLNCNQRIIFKDCF